MTYLDQYQSIVGPCPDCLSLPVVSEQAAREIVVAQERLKATSPGYAHAIEGIGIRCDACLAKREAIYAAEDTRNKAHIMRNNLYCSGLMPETSRHDQVKLSKPQHDHRAPEQWATLRRGDYSGNLWIEGPSGVGKTFLAHCIANLVIDKAMSAAVFSHSKFRTVASEWNRESMLRPYILSYCLILDDIDKVSWSLREVEVLFSLLDGRQGRKGFIIITSNMSGQSLAKIIRPACGENSTMVAALFDRMKPMTKIVMEGESLR